MAITDEDLNRINRIFDNSLNRGKTKLIPASRSEYKETALPTEADKASPKSSYSERDLMYFYRNGFPRNCKLMTVVNTNSMEPLIDAGDIVCMEKISSSATINVGDICMYGLNSDFILHRVIKIKDNKCLMKGDNNLFADGWIPKEEITHKLISIAYGKKQGAD